MAEWNLSVQLTGQGSDLSRTLRNLSREADAASRNVDALRRDIGRLRSESGRPIRVRFDVDAARLRADAQAAVRAASAGLDLDVGLRISDRGLTRMRASVRDTAHSLNTLQRAAREAKNELEELEGRAVTTAAAIRRITTAATRARGRLDDLSTGTRTFRTDLDDLDGSLTRVTGRLGALRGRVGGTGGGSGSGGSGLDIGLGTLIPLATSALPLVAGLSTYLAPLPGAFAAATVPAAAFGIAIAGQIAPLTEVAEAETKYEESVREHGRTSAEAVEAQITYQKALAALPPETQKAAISFARLKTTFGDWSDEMSGFTMEPLTNGMTVLEQVIPRLTPHVKSASTQLDRLVNLAGGAVQTPGFDRMASKFADFTDRQLEDMTDGVIHFLRVLSEGGAFQDGPIAEFMAYARENGPAAREALRAISDAVVTLLRAAAEAGPTMLTLVTAAARLVAALPPELVGIILQVATALKLLQLSGAGMAALAAGTGRVRTAIAALGTTAAAAGGGLAGLRAAFLSLGLAARASIVVAGIGLLVYALSELSEMGRQTPPDVEKLTTSLQRLGATGKVTGEAARVFGKDLDGLYDKVRSLTDPSTADDVQQFLVGWTGWDSTPVKDAKENIDAIDKSLAGLVKNGQADLAADALKRLTAEYGKGGRDTGEFTKRLDDYKSAVADAKFEQELAAQSMGLFGEAAQRTSQKLAAQKASADGLRQSIVALNDVNRAAGSAMSAFEQSIDDATEAVKDHGSALKMRDGELDLGSEKAREAEKVLSELAANTDAAATAAREQGKSWEYVTGIQDRGRKAFIDSAQAMGLSGKQAKALANRYLEIPDKRTTVVEMRTEDAIQGLNSVIAAIKKTPGAKSVKVKALTSDAVSLLRELGFTVTKLPNGKFKVTADTATARQRLRDIQAARDGLKNKTISLSVRDRASAQARAIQAAIDKVRGKQVTITTRYVAVGVEGTAGRNNAKLNGHAQGAVVDYYADGGIQRGGIRRFANGAENHVAQIAPAGSWRVWAEPETMGEAYIPFAPSKRVRSRAIAEESVRRLGGDPASITWNADGGLTNWSYDPVSGSLYSPSDAASIGHKTRKVKTKGGKVKEVKYYDLAAVEKKLISLGQATVVWNRNLEKVADRAGGDVAKALASMGNEGVALAAKMARGTDKYVASMSIALRRMMQEARASLTDFTLQLNHATGNNAVFQNNLVKLAAMGYGDLASHLAAKGDQASMDLAADAASSRSKAAKANTAVKKANAQLSSEEMESLIQIIAAISSKTVGIHQVAGKTGLGEDVIIEVANKAKAQISKSLGSKATKFLADLGKANKQQAYADGGIRAGMYATQGGIIRFAEPSTRGEAYIPLGANKRRTAMPVLTDVASRFGVGLTDGQSSRVVIVREQGPLIGASHFHIGDRKSDRDLARAIEARQAYQLRRLGRGGVGARG